MPSTLLAPRGGSALTRTPAPPAPVTLVAPRSDVLPTLSTTAARAMSLVSAPNIPLVELAALLRTDAAMAAAVLRMANSIKYRGRAPVKDIQQGIVRVGLRECGKLVCAVGVQGVYGQLPPAARDACDRLHKHGLFVGCLAAELDRAVELGQAAAAFTAGLLHDIGRVLICAKAGAGFGAIDPLDFDEDSDPTARERDALGTDHTLVGYEFATANDLPDGVRRVIARHHDPAGEAVSPELVAVVAAADRVANYAQREHRVADYDAGACPGFRVLAAKWPAARAAAFRAAVPRAVVRALRETRGMLRSARG